MNKKLNLAVAAALALGASAAQAGITIPAGDWTIDIGGNVNAFAMTTDVDNADQILGSVHNASDDRTRRGISTGLLPSWLGFTGKTRQNDLDIEWTISFQPGVSNNTVHGDGSVGGENATFLNRQTFVKFGDKSWGSLKLGKDIGIYASQAILNDMTLLGVGAFHAIGQGLSGPAINTTTGGIGSGYQYAAWRGQITYQSPNWNGFDFTIGLMNPNQVGPGALNDTPQSRYGLEGQVQYSWAGDVSGKVWSSFGSYKVKDDASFAGSESIHAWDVGANINVAGFGLTGYYYDGKGNGTATLGFFGIDANGDKRDGNGGYVQATYTLPGVGTKLGIAYGESQVDETDLDRANLLAGASEFMDKDQRWTVGAYHPLTKSLNLVAEYNDQEVKGIGNGKNESQTISLGAILFF